jgi:hypothetical protein
MLGSEIEEVRDLGDVSVARQRLRGQGTKSGAQMEHSQWQVTRRRDSKAGTEYLQFSPAKEMAEGEQQTMKNMQQMQGT